MKKIILTALAAAALQFTQAQVSNQRPVTESKPQEATPEQLATRQSNHLQKVLTLTEEQKQKVYQAIVARATAMQQVKAKNAGNHKAIQAEAKPIKEQFINNVNATLTPDQQKKWDEFRLQQKQKQEARKNQQATPADGATPAPTKLEPGDDGMKD
ncbi:MAG TPA: hypothetical protein VKG26_15645 [Bacteroidia bacterium]|nr:hypothetical protein [Bacteroidia bacterium]